MLKKPERYVKTDIFQVEGIYTLYYKYFKNKYLFLGESHDFWEVMYCIKGHAIVCSGEKIFELSSKQVIFFEPMKFHSFRVEAEMGAEFFIATFDIKGNLSEKISNDVLETSSEIRQSINEIMNYFKFNISEMEKRPQDNLIKMVLSVPYSVNTIINMLENFIILILNASVVSSNRVKTHEAEIYSNVLIAIDNSINRKITVEELAKTCNVSQSYLKCLFKKYNGLGIHKYILKMKINLVKKFLFEGKTVTEIAEHLGFASQNYLSAAFKRETGMSPTEYKSCYD